MREKRVVLKDGADVALVGLQMLDAGAVETDFSRGGFLESGDHAQRGGLAAARGTEQGEELAAREVQRNAVDGVVRGVVLRNVAKL